MIIIQIDKDIRDMHAIEHDINTRFPTFQFKNGLKPYDLSNCNVRIYGVNSLIKSFFNDLEIVNAKQGIARLELTDPMLVKGITKMQFVIMPNTGGELKTRIFNLVNGESLVDSDALEGSDEYKAFENALKKLDGYEGRLSNVETESSQNKANLSTANSRIQSNTDTIAELRELINEANSKIAILEDLKNSISVGGDKNKGYEEFKLPNGKVWVHEFGWYNSTSGGGVKMSRMQSIMACSATPSSTVQGTCTAYTDGENTLRFAHNFSGTIYIYWNAWGYK